MSTWCTHVNQALSRHHPPTSRVIYVNYYLRSTMVGYQRVWWPLWQRSVFSRRSHVDTAQGSGTVRNVDWYGTTKTILMYTMPRSFWSDSLFISHVRRKMESYNGTLLSSMWGIWRVMWLIYHFQHSWLNQEQYTAAQMGLDWLW